MRLALSSLCLAAVFALSPSAVALPLIIQPGEGLRVDFTGPSASYPLHPQDALWLAVPATPATPAGSKASLYLGNGTHLGTTNASPVLPPSGRLIYYWKTPTSLQNLPGQTLADLTLLRSPTAAGFFVVTFGTNTTTIDDSNVELFYGWAVGGTMNIEGGNNLNLSGLSVVPVPEPSTAIALLLGLAALGAYARKT